MADSKLDGLTAATTAGDTDLTILYQGGVTKKFTWASVKATLKTYFDGIYSATSHNHSGTYEPADATILKDADIGNAVQAYDVDTAKLDVLQTFTVSQRGTLTTDNDGSFDMNITNKFKCTPTVNFTLTFTNIAAQGGTVLLVNSGGYTVSAAATTKVSSTLLATISAAGTYILGYESDGTNVYVTSSQALS
jgi:hypothetical protein